jgi:gluconolactonase
VAQKAGEGFQFTEGPAADLQGNVYFTDVRASRIYRWSAIDGSICLFREGTGGANGLYFEPGGSLVMCQGEAGRIASIDLAGRLSVLADQYGGKPFNRPNDLWCDPQGGVYFSDPLYGRGEVIQGGEHVYYIAPDRSAVTRVVEDMVRPNGLIGAPDGRTLYITDAGGRKSWRYAVAEDGSLSDKTLLCEVGADGMTLDARGNVYLCEEGVVVCSPVGERLVTLVIPERPTNCCFAGADRKTLFVTARTTVWTLQMAVTGAQ